MVIYEVRISVEDSIREAYRNWLKKHMAEVVEKGGFEGAECFREEVPSGTVWVVHYRARSREVVETYLRLHAPALRADGVKRFGEAFRAERRILHSESLA